MLLTFFISPIYFLQKLVAKPDQLIKRRGKLGLIKVKADYEEAKGWISERLGADQKASREMSRHSVNVTKHKFVLEDY